MVQHKEKAKSAGENQSDNRLSVGNLSQNASVNKIWWGSFEVTWVRANIKVDHEVFSFDGGSYKKKRVEKNSRIEPRANAAAMNGWSKRDEAPVQNFM